MLDRGVHCEHCGARRLPGDDDVDVMAAAQAVIDNGEQTVCVRRQINAHDFGLLVHDVIRRTRPLNQGIEFLRAAAHLAQDSFAEPAHVEAELKRIRRTLTQMEDTLDESDWE